MGGGGGGGGGGTFLYLFLCALDLMMDFSFIWLTKEEQTGSNSYLDQVSNLCGSLEDDPFVYGNGLLSIVGLYANVPSEEE